MNGDQQTARLMRWAVAMLATAVDDVEAGRYSHTERTHLADGLDQLTTALRADQPTTVDSEVSR